VQKIDIIPTCFYEGKQAMKQLKTVIFDVVGTIATTDRNDHRIACNRAFIDADLNWRWDEYLYGIWLTITDLKDRIQHFSADFKSDFL